MKLVNFSHALSPGQIEQLRDNFGLNVAPDEVITVRTHLDPAQPFAPQVVALVDAVGWSRREWETNTPLIVLPALADVAALVAAEIEGRSGHLPAILRRKPVEGTLTPQFEIAEILNLYSQRNNARQYE